MNAVKVIVRVRPRTRSGPGSTAATAAAATAETDTTVRAGVDVFTFDSVLGDASSQKDVYNACDHIVNGVFDGYNGTIFAYGQTASGKTYTMDGQLDDAELRGVVPRAVSRIFGVIEASPQSVVWTCHVGVVEIYMERVRDLLDPSKSNLVIRESADRGIWVEAMTEAVCATEADVMVCLRLAKRNRTSAETGMNDQSSRSHSVCMLRVTQEHRLTGNVKFGKLCLVDLAGSEMVRKTGSEGQQLEEAKTINRSLSALGLVITALTDGRSTHVPYRDSKLTRMLQESLGGSSRTCIIVNVSADSRNALETLSTLRFGQRAKAIKNKVAPSQVRSVEELMALLDKSEKAIELQSVYIITLENQLAIARAALAPMYAPASVVDAATAAPASVVAASTAGADESSMYTPNFVDASDVA